MTSSPEARPAVPEMVAIEHEVCHSFGRRPFPTGDGSRNLAWLAPPTFGEVRHSNLVIGALERCRLARDVVRIGPERQLLGHTGGAGVATAEEV